MAQDCGYRYNPAESRRRSNRSLDYSVLQFEEPSQSIRLLRFSESCNDDALIVCELSIYASNSLPSYTAISYTWGDAQNLVPISVNGTFVNVRLNCWQALWQVRRSALDACYWIDSICIDQINNVEKNAQVKLMASIYSRAEYVAVCIGDREEDEPWQSKYIEKYGLYDKSLDAEKILTRDELSDYDEQLKSMLDELTKLKYFNRLWVIQECILAKSIKVYWSDRILTLNSIQPFSGGKSKGRYKPRHHTIVESLRYAAASAQTFSMNDTILLFGNRGCSDPRDRIYGLLSLNSKLVQENIRIDYSQSLLCTLRDVVRVYTNLHASGQSEINYHDQESFFGVLRTIEKLVKEWQRTYDLPENDKSFPEELTDLLKATRNGPSKDTVDLFKVTFTNCFWWIIGELQGQQSQKYGAMLRQGEGSKTYYVPEYVKHRMNEHLHNVSHFPDKKVTFAHQASTVHTEVVAMDVPFPAGDFHVPSDTSPGDILLFVENSRKAPSDGGSLFLIARPDLHQPNLLKVIGIASAIQLYHNKDPIAIRWQLYRHRWKDLPGMTAYFHRDDVLAMALNRDAYTRHLVDPLDQLTNSSYLIAPSAPGGTGDMAFEDIMLASRADVVVQKCMKSL